MKSNPIKSYREYRASVFENKRFHKLEDGFINDGRNHYVYRVKDLEDNTYYYGSRSTKEAPIIDFWKYRTSGCKKDLIREYGESRFRVKIIAIFDNKSDKICYESFLHQYFDVRNNDRFFNRMNQTPFGIDFSGMKHSEETKERMRGRIFSEETKEKMSLAKRRLVEKGDLEKIQQDVIRKRSIPYINEHGIETTSLLEAAKKAAETLRTSGNLEERNRNISLALNREILIDGKITTPAKENSKKIHAKMRENGTYEIANKKRLNTIDTNNLWPEIGKRISKSKNEKILKDGEFLTRAQHSGKKGSETKRKNSRFLNIMKNDEILYENVPLVEVRRMNQALVYATKENPIGQTVQSKLNLNTNRKLHMIGWYVEEYK